MFGTTSRAAASAIPFVLGKKGLGPRMAFGPGLFVGGLGLRPRGHWMLGPWPPLLAQGPNHIDKPAPPGPVHIIISNSWKLVVVSY